MDDLVNTGWPVLMALSNKDFVGETLGVELTERLEGTLAATALAAAAGARMFRVHEVAATRRVLEMVASIQGHAPADAHGEGTCMTASELVAAISPLRAHWPPGPATSGCPTAAGPVRSWTVERTGSGEGRTNHLGGAARPQRGRHRRIGDREHLTAGRRAGRRADRAGLGLHRRHRDPGDRRRRPRRQP